MTKAQCLAPLFGAVCSVFVSAQQFQDQTTTRLPIQAVWSEEVDAGDVDGDGDLDLAYGKGDGFASAGTARQNTLLINNGAGVFTDQTATRLPVQTGHTKDLDFVDVDDDGDLDLVTANAFNEQPRLLLNDGLGFFTDATATHFPVLLLNSFGVAAGDLDADGDLDLVFNDSGASTFGGTGGQTRVFINDGTGHFTNETAARMPVSLVTSAVDANVADVDGDADLDILTVSRDGSPSKIYLNDGAGNFVEGGPLPADGSGTYEYELGDVDGDLDADIFVVGVSGLAEGTFVNTAGVFTTGVGTVVGNLSSDDNDASLGDFDNDGDLDAVVAALSTAERFFTNNGAGVFTYQAGFVTSFTDSSMDGELADVDGDGDLDYLSAVGESGAFQNRVYINTSATAADTVAPLFRIPTYSAATPFGDVRVRVGIKDALMTEGDPRYQSVVLNWTVAGVPGSAPMKWAGFDLFQAVIPGVPSGAAVSFTVSCTDREGNVGLSVPTNFSPAGLAPLLLSVSTTGVGDVTITLTGPGQAFVEEFVVVSSLTYGAVGTGPFLGLGPDALAFLSLPFGFAPFHGAFNASGVSSASFPAGTIPAGLTLDARGFSLPAGTLPQLSNIVRKTF